MYKCLSVYIRGMEALWKWPKTHYYIRSTSYHRNRHLRNNYYLCWTACDYSRPMMTEAVAEMWPVNMLCSQRWIAAHDMAVARANEADWNRFQFHIAIAYRSNRCIDHRDCNGRYRIDHGRRWNCSASNGCLAVVAETSNVLQVVSCIWMKMNRAKWEITNEWMQLLFMMDVSEFGLKDQVWFEVGHII